jgi:hypothetical protein
MSEAVKDYSQFGEQVIIAEILDRLKIGHGWFIDLGSSDGMTDSNTFELVRQGWCGLMVEASRQRFSQAITNLALYPKVTLVQKRITCEPGARLDDFAAAAYLTLDSNLDQTEPDLLSIDVDGNDYWIWKATELKAKIVVIEYNSSFGPSESKSIKYEPGFEWEGDGYHGASARALELLGISKGYTMVACTTANLFFVRNDLAKPFERISVDTVPVKAMHRPSARQMIDV